jgi:alkaline phosphatase D
MMWQVISKNNPDVWVWGGDIVYSDHEFEDMAFLKESYARQKNNPAYKKFSQSTQIIGSWDDHDYGFNDGGIEFSKKKESQKIFLDFMDVASDSPRRKQAGIYYAHDYQVDGYSIKIIVLDTRYFRTGLTDDPDPHPEKRYMPNTYGDRSMLGKVQWQWLQDQLNHSTADFNVISSSIQFLSPYHGFEKWANMPHEVDKLEKLIMSSQAKNVVIITGDRHISEISRKDLAGLDYPLVDFTSSGLNRALNREKIEAQPLQSWC